MTTKASAGLVGLVALAGAALVIGPFLSPSQLARFNLALIAIMSAAALNILMGRAGQVSLGQAAFLATGAYTAALVNIAWGFNLLVALPVGAIVAAMLGFLIGLPSLRFRGFYLALTTLALHFIVTFAATRLQEAFGGLAGFRLPPPNLGPIAIRNDLDWFYLLTGLTFLVLAGFHNLSTSKVGRAWTAVRDRDLAASIIGIDVPRYKLIAFVVSSLVAGAAGVLQAYYVSNVAVETYSLDLAISFIAMIIIGGLGSIWGSVLGAIAVTQLPFVVQALAAAIDAGSADAFAVYEIQAGAFGFIIIVFLLFEPDGLVGLIDRIGRRALALRTRRGVSLGNER